MKYTILFCLLLCLPALAVCQQVDPVVIHQNDDIILQDTDVYYYPFAPPASTDTSWNLSSVADELRNPDGIGSNGYAPRTHGIQLNNWSPHGVRLGDTAVWMRLFTANDKPGGGHSDIIAGSNVTNDTLHTGGHHGPVIISANEDVDFRATGTIKLEDGFHVMPGAYFHAYIAPTFDTTVFSDEFNDATKFSNNWLVFDNTFAGPAQGADCSFDTNIALVTDPDAGDTHALRIDLKEDSVTCNDNEQINQACTLTTKDTSKHKQFIFSTALIQSCPFPFNSGTDPVATAYQNAPYGKWEVREKVPVIEHHTNNYGDGQGNEWNLNERYNGGLDQIHPGFTRRFLYGPFQGKFGRRTIGGVDTGIFYSSAAHFTKWNNPSPIIINNFPYEVQFTHSDLSDTILMASATTGHEGGFPSSLVADSANAVTFYYYKNANNTSDPLRWNVSSDGRYFTGPYGLDSHGDSLYFNKAYQPTSIVFYDSTLFTNDTLSCHWDHTTGKIIFTQLPADTGSHRGYGFSYNCDEGPTYPVPAVHVDSTSYKYHTYTMELLPHEARFLVDGAVIRRFPDRLIPAGDKRYDYVTGAPRAPMNIIPGEIDMDGGATFSAEKAYFDANSATCQGCWTDSHGQHIASHLIDYVKVWDLPVDCIVPKFPH